MKKLFIIPFLIASINAKAQISYPDSVAKYNAVALFELSLPQPNIVKIRPFLNKLGTFQASLDSAQNRTYFTIDTAAISARKKYLQSKYNITLQ